MVIRVGLIGCGAIGAWHARILSETAQADLVAVCDHNAERAEAHAWGAQVFTDEDAFFATPMEAVVIATPEAAHLDQVKTAAEKGLHVLVEKPVATSVAQVAAMQEVVKSAGIIAMAAHVERFEPGSVGLVDAVEQGIAGQVSTIMARRQFSPGGVERFAGTSSTLRILAIHDFDLVRWVHPAPIEAVHAVAGRGAIHARCGMDDHVATTIRFADGAMAMVESGWTLPPSYADFNSPEGWQGAGNNRLEVFGAEGFVSNDMGLRMQPLVAFAGAEGFRAAGIRHQPVVHGRVRGALRAEVEHFLACCDTGTTPAVTLQDARRAVALLEAAERALASGQPQGPVG